MLRFHFIRVCLSDLAETAIENGRQVSGVPARGHFQEQKDHSKGPPHVLVISVDFLVTDADTSGGGETRGDTVQIFFCLAR